MQSRIIKALTPLKYIKNRIFHYKGPEPLRVIVTGPPRSGTSFLAGLVVRMGFSPGPQEELRQADKNNLYGYYENMKLMEIDHELLNKFGGSVIDPPDLPGNWTDQCEEEKKKIHKIVRNFGIEVYKGNMLVILADLYAEIFPDAKWIMINRSEKETVKSMSASMSMEDKRKLRTKRLEGWEKTKASSNCLTVRYEDFMDNPQRMVSKISDYLSVNLTDKMFRECVAFFKPRSSKKSD